MFRKKVVYVICIILWVWGCVPTEKVVEVVDGDTFMLESGESVRLLGINTPEHGEPGADLAKAFLIQLVYMRQVRLKKDQNDRDDYDRLLRYVYIDDIFVNAELVRMGLAEARSYPPDTLYRELLEGIERIAVRNSKGLWAFSVFQPPDTATEPGNVPRSSDQTGVISWQDAHLYYGTTKTVKGTVVATNNTGKVCFLNFHTNWKKYFTAVIFSSDFDKFPAHPEDIYLNQKVLVTGLIKEYKGKPEIILKSPSQITIIE
jgi:micrococcal nuclease